MKKEVYRRLKLVDDIPMINLLSQSVPQKWDKKTTDETFGKCGEVAFTKLNLREISKFRGWDCAQNPISRRFNHFKVIAYNRTSRCESRGAKILLSMLVPPIYATMVGAVGTLEF